MVCTQLVPRFRLLDGNVGWDALPEVGKSGDTFFYDEHGLRLTCDEPRLGNELLAPYLTPAWLAPGHLPGEWFMGDGKPRGHCDPAGLFRRDPCAPSCQNSWIDLPSRVAMGNSLRQLLAVATRKNRLAVIDRRNDKLHRVLIWSIPDGRLAGEFHLQSGDLPHAIVFSTWGELLVSVTRDQDTQWLLHFDLAGQARNEIEIRAGDHAASQPLVRLRTAKDGSAWAAEGAEFGPFHLWRIGPANVAASAHCQPQRRFDIARLTDIEFFHQASKQLAANVRRTGLVSTGHDYFCLAENADKGSPATCCYDRRGLLLPGPPIDADTFSLKLREAIFETRAIDSFIPRCNWHRVRIDAGLPIDTSYEIQVASSEMEYHLDDNGQPDTDKPFRPHDHDWQLVSANANDFLIDQPPGRYLFVRIKLSGSSGSTPVIRRARVDFPRVTSLEQLPAVYRENPEAEDFTERFLSLFDAALEDLDQAIERYPALFDAGGVPEEVLVWLGAFLGIAFDPDWDVSLRRELLAAAPRLFRARGTVAGLKETIKLVFGSVPAVEEQAKQRSWGIVQESAHLGAFRLFGKSEARFRVGRSSLGAAPLRSFGNPDHDPLRADAHRFTVLLPPTSELRKFGVLRLNRLIENQKPAHTRHQVRIGGQGFFVGRRSAIGIDTQLVPTAAPVIGSCNDSRPCSGVRLGRASILRQGPHRPICGFRIGINAAIGLHTSLE